MKNIFFKVLAYIFRKTTLNRLLFYFGARVIFEFSFYYSNSEINVIGDWLEKQFSNPSTGQVVSAIFKTFFVSGDWKIGVICLGLFIIIAILKDKEIWSEGLELKEENKKSLQEIIFGKNSQKDVSLSLDYLVRKEEPQLKKILQKQNILLLTGKSFCGKSEIAKRIANHYINEGYFYFRTNDPFEAERFLNISGENRICLLEDPFGHSIESQNYSSIRKIEELLKNLLDKRKLIITSRFEILNAIFNTPNLSKWKIEGSDWIDLTLKDSNFLIKAWNLFSNKTNIPRKIKIQIEQYLLNANQEHLLQIGNLKHLANTSLNELKNKSIEELCHIARIDSKNLSVSIKDKGLNYVKSFISIGLGATIIKNISLIEISYILKEEKMEASFFPENKFPSIGNVEDRVSKFPVYEHSNLLSQEFIQIIGYFQERGYIDYENGLITFTHPHYQESFKYLLVNKRLDIKQIVFQMIWNGITCLQPDTAIECVNQIPFLYKNLSSDSDKTLLNEYLYAGSSRSMFPKIRDKCDSILLMNRLVLR